MGRCLSYGAIHASSIWLRTGSYLADIYRFLSHTENKIKELGK